MDCAPNLWSFLYFSCGEWPTWLLIHYQGLLLKQSIDSILINGMTDYRVCPCLEIRIVSCGEIKDKGTNENLLQPKNKQEQHQYYVCVDKFEPLDENMLHKISLRVTMN